MVDIEQRVRELLGAGGAVARRLPGYELREGQLRFACAAARALASGEDLVAEAGTGIGKSFGYLLPAILLAEERRAPVVISTRTKALQEQLNSKDLPFLQAVLPQEFTWTVAVGRNNYVCMRRLERARRGQSSMFEGGSEAETFERIAALAIDGRRSGTRDELDFVPRAGIWDAVCAEQGNCLGKRCRYYEPCPWQRSRRRLSTAQLLIVNHSLYFADLALRQQDVALLPEHAAVVFDEAHHLEEIASQALGGELSAGMFEWVLGRMITRDGNRGLLEPHARTWLARLNDLRGRVSAFFDEVGHRLDGSGDTVALSEADGLEDTLSGPVESAADAIGTWGKRVLREEEGMELGTRVRRLQQLADLVREFCRKPHENEVRWVEQRRRFPVLRAAPVRVSKSLAEMLWGKEGQSRLLVSATLGPPEREFGWLRERLGLVQARSLREGSPFPYEENVQLELPGNLPDPGSEPREFERESADVILERCVANEGRALVLGTSRRWLEACRERIEGRLRDAGLEVLVQGDAPLPQLLDRKREVPASVLFGLDSLWEGIDIPGPAVTLVVLVRLPFAVPSHPLTAARVREIERRGGNAFAELSVPQALLRFQQGFGRLVRRHGDGGVVLVLDPRVRTKAYGRRFVEVLPRCRGE